MRIIKILCIVGLMSQSLFGQVNWPIPCDSLGINQKKIYLSSIQKGKNKQPNIVLIVADDLGKFDLSIYGNTIIETPHIDQLAMEGAMFTDGYASAPICSPSRAGMLTGRYQQRFGYQLQPQQRYPKSKFEWWSFKNLMNTNDIEPSPFQTYPSKSQIPRQGLPPSEITITEMLKQVGYTTAWIGKWHLGYEAPLLPGNFGFDFQYGCYEAFTLFGKIKDPNIVNAPINEFTDKHIWKKGRTGACAIRKNGILIDENEYITYAFAREAKKFITENKSQPFFLYMPVTAPHTPYQAPKNIYDSLSFIKEHNKRVYYSMIIALDKMVGDVIQHLEKENLGNNTLIIFTSDNGAPLYSHTVTNAPLAGGKFTFYEGGINVPLILNYKNNIDPGTMVNQPVMLFDIYATIADAAGIPIPKDRIIDGTSLLPWTVSNSQQPVHNSLYWYSGYNMAIRKGNWKLIMNTQEKTVELFQLEIDRSESTNQEAAEINTKEALTKELTEWVNSMPPLLWPGLVDYEVYINGKLTKWRV